MRIASLAKTVEDERVVGVVCLLEITAVECDADEFALLDFGALEGVHTVDGVQVVLEMSQVFTTHLEASKRTSRSRANVVGGRENKLVMRDQLTSDVMRITKTLLLTSVFIPCSLAS